MDHTIIHSLEALLSTLYSETPRQSLLEPAEQQTGLVVSSFFVQGLMCPASRPSPYKKEECLDGGNSALVIGF